MQYFQLILSGIKNNSFLRDDVLQFLVFFAGLSSTPPASVSMETHSMTNSDNLTGQSYHQPAIPIPIQSLLQAVPTQVNQFEVCY